MTAYFISHPTMTARPDTEPAGVDVRALADVWTRQRTGASMRVRDGLNAGGPNALLARCAR
jgi:hypothetical protein